jgi:hypothetical protein
MPFPEPESATPACPLCSYPRAGLAPDTPCPECGAPADAAPPTRITRSDLAAAALLAAPAIGALIMVYLLAPIGEVGEAIGARAAVVRAGVMLWLGVGCWWAWGRPRSAGAPVAAVALSLVVAVFGLVLIETAVWLAAVIISQMAR